MGWYQDNFPGSPAQRQRMLVSRGVVIYTLVTGTLIYLFSPMCRRVRKDFAEGKELTDFRWAQEKRETRRIEKGDNLFTIKPTIEQFIDVQKNKDKFQRMDLAGPDVSDETIRNPSNRRGN